MKRLLAGTAVVGSLVGSLAGCAAPPNIEPATPEPSTAMAAPTASAAETPASHVTTISTAAAANTVHSLSGRLSLRVHRPADGATDGGSLLFEFEGREEAGTLLLTTPIGTTLAKARWGAEGAEIITAQGRRAGAKLDDIASALLGQPLPLAALLHWIRAEPWGGAPSQPLAEGFEQLGWQISLAGWHEGVVTAHRRPRPDNPRDTDILVRARVDSVAPTAR